MMKRRKQKRKRRKRSLEHLCDLAGYKNNSSRFRQSHSQSFLGCFWPYSTIHSARAKVNRQGLLGQGFEGFLRPQSDSL